MSGTLNRRDFLAASAVSAAAASAIASQPEAAKPAAAAPADRVKLKGRINHSACRWCYGGMPLDDLCANAAAIGLKSVELLNPDEFATAQKHGLTCAVASFVKSNPI